MRFLVCYISINFILLSGVALATPVEVSATAPAKSKVEELFIWKMSDELSLTPVEEKKFGDLVKELNKKKATLNTDMQNHLQQMQSLKTEADKTRELSAYKKNLQAYNRLSEDELDKMKSLLGVGRTIKYLEVKQDMTNRLKSLLANPEAKSKAESLPLPAPKVIEE